MMNMSLGRPQPNAAQKLMMRQACDNTLAAGVVVAACEGNRKAIKPRAAAIGCGSFIEKTNRVITYLTTTVVVPTIVTGMFRPCCDMVMERFCFRLLLLTSPVCGLMLAVPV